MGSKKPGKKGEDLVQSTLEKVLFQGFLILDGKSQNGAASKSGSEDGEGINQLLDIHKTHLVKDTPISVQAVQAVEKWSPPPLDIMKLV